MKHLTKSFEVKAVDDEGSFEAVIATLGVVDHDGDLTVPGAFKRQSVSILPAHDRRSASLGKAEIFEKGDKAIARGKFNLEIQAAREMHATLKFDLANGDPVQEWSYGFQIKESEEETRDGDTIRILKSLDVFEVSPVLRGAGMGTGTISAKDREKITLSDDLAAVAKEVRRVAERAAEVIAMRLKQKQDGKRSGRPGLGAKAKESLEELIDGLAFSIMQREVLRKLLGQTDEPGIAEKLLAKYIESTTRIDGHI